MEVSDLPQLATVPDLYPLTPPITNADAAVQILSVGRDLPQRCRLEPRRAQHVVGLRAMRHLKAAVAKTLPHANYWAETCRSFYRCPWCGNSPPFDWAGRSHCPLEGELWFPFPGGYFSCGPAVVHLIEQHGYCPPTAYIAALAAVQPDGSFNAETAYATAVFRS